MFLHLSQVWVPVIFLSELIIWFQRADTSTLLPLFIQNAYLIKMMHF